MRIARGKWFVIAFGIGHLLAEGAAGGDRGGTISREYADAKALFEKLWEPGEASPRGGDGLGPLYNERSCVG